MKIGTKQEMNTMDDVATSAYGVPSLLLMEHAAYGMFQYIKEEIGKNITIVCGTGNNGGDGLALARQLTVWSDKKVRVVLLATPDKLSDDGKVYHEICQKLQVECYDFNTQTGQSLACMEVAEIIVDAIFGTGLTRPVEGSYKKAIEKINYCHTAKVLSVDIPSGIACDTGEVLGIAVKAHETYTFQMPKVGMCIYPGVAYAGRVRVVDIGIPGQYLETMQTKYKLITNEDVQKLIPKRAMRSHKGTYGKLLIIGGSKEMSGAITLAAKGAMKAGAGTVTIVVPDCIQDRVAINCIDAMTIGLESKEGYFSKQGVLWLEANLKKYDVVAFGPGIGRTQEVSQMLRVILEHEIACVIDADGLYPLNKYLELIKLRQKPVVITPHPKEFSRLTTIPIAHVLDKPLTYVEAFHQEVGAHLVLKLERSIVAAEGCLWINQSGNPALAKGGSGDVLTGLVAGSLAWSRCPESALVIGVYVHGSAADERVMSQGEYGLLPSELYEGVGKVLSNLQKV